MKVRFKGNKLSDNSHTTYHSDGSTSETYKNVTDNGYTTYGSDGTKSTTYKDVTGDSYTTYYLDGSKSRTYKNITDSGYTTYHPDGSKTKVYKTLNNNDYTSSSNNIGDWDISDSGYGIIGVFALIICVICSFVVLQFYAVIPVSIVLASIISAVKLENKIGKSNAFILMQPILFLGLQRFMYHAWVKSLKNDLLTGTFGCLGCIVIEIALELYLLITKIDYEDEDGNGNGFIITCISVVAVITPLSVIAGESIVFAFFDILFLIIVIIVVNIRYKKRNKSK